MEKLDFSTLDSNLHKIQRDVQGNQGIHRLSCDQWHQQQVCECPLGWNVQVTHEKFSNSRISHKLQHESYGNKIEQRASLLQIDHVWNQLDKVLLGWYGQAKENCAKFALSIFELRR